VQVKCTPDHYINAFRQALLASGAPKRKQRSVPICNPSSQFEFDPPVVVSSRKEDIKPSVAPNAGALPPKRAKRMTTAIWTTENWFRNVHLLRSYTYDDAANDAFDANLIEVLFCSPDVRKSIKRLLFAGI
jgi:hypothetical protein